MTYSETLLYMYAQLPMYHRIGAQAYKADLGNTLALCRMLENPQESFLSIHVTGTNGKGSVSHMLASILQSAGFRTGLYTSPHLKDFRERIRVNGKMISKCFVTGFVDRYRKSFDRINPSFFEMTVAMAFDYFRHEQVDIAVVEVGLGGRLDSTNVIHPLVSVITNVSFDHMQFLGNTLELIATEKAGIIKQGVPVVVGETRAETVPVFLRKAAECHSGFLFADQCYSCVSRQEAIPGSISYNTMDIYRGDQLYIEGLACPLTGGYQAKNIRTVIGTCEMLEKQGILLSTHAITKGIANVVKNTGLAGRWQILGYQPLTICDTGHNEAGIREVLAQIEATPYNHLHIVLGVVNDKHLPPILSLLPRDATYYFCRPDIPRGLDADELRREALKAGLRGNAYYSVGLALEAARLLASVDDLVFVGGSTFVVAEVV